MADKAKPPPSALRTLLTPDFRDKAQRRRDREVDTLMAQAKAGNNAPALETLEQATREGSIERSFGMIRQAERLMVMAEEDTGPSVIEIWSEASNKLSGWRLEAVRSLLGKKDGDDWALDDEKAKEKAKVVQVLDILRSFQAKGWDNLHQRNWLLGGQGATGVVALLGCLGVLALGQPYNLVATGGVGRSDEQAELVEERASGAKGAELKAVTEATSPKPDSPAVTEAADEGDAAQPTIDGEHVGEPATDAVPEPETASAPSPAATTSEGETVAVTGRPKEDRPDDAARDLSTTPSLPSPPVPFVVLGGVVFFGLLGASISGTHTTISRLSQDQPAASALLAETSGALARLALGPMSALVLFTLLHTPVGMAVYEVSTVWGLYVVCFAAGFSEKLVVMAVEAVGTQGSSTQANR